MVKKGGQFKSATHGQFKLAQGGQFDRSLQVIHFLIRMDNIDKTINLNPKNQNRKKRS